MNAFLDRCFAFMDRLKRIHPVLPWALTMVVLLPLPHLAWNNYQVYLINYIFIMITWPRA